MAMLLQRYANLQMSCGNMQETVTVQHLAAEVIALMAIMCHQYRENKQNGLHALCSENKSNQS